MVVGLSFGEIAQIILSLVIVALLLVRK